MSVRARKKNRSARMLANARKDHSSPLAMAAAIKKLISSILRPSLFRLGFDLN